LKNSPGILTGLGCAGVIATAVVAVRATPKAIDLIGDYYDRHRELPNKIEIVKATWKCYIPAAIIGATSIGCIIGANCVNNKRNAALAMLYSVSEATIREYQDKVIETIGKNKERKIRDEINQDYVNKISSNDQKVIFTGDGKVLCFDKLSGRQFESSYEKIRQIVNECNLRLRNENWLSLNDLYFELGLKGNELGDIMGFDIEKGYIDPIYSTCLDENNRPCLVIDFKVYPMYNY